MTRLHWRAFGAIAATLLTVSLSAQQAPRHTEAGILELLKERVDRKRSVGMVVGVIDADGRRVAASYGDPGSGAMTLDPLALRAGKSYEALVTERVLRPLGMQHTSIALDAWMQKHLVRGHDNSGQPAANWDIRTVEGAGALRSTMEDMLIFAAANLKDGPDPLHRGMAAAQVVRAPTGRPDLSIALGWHVRNVTGHSIVWHNGGTGGYRTWMGFDKNRKIAAVVLTNSTHGADDLGYELLK